MIYQRPYGDSWSASMGKRKSYSATSDLTNSQSIHNSSSLSTVKNITGKRDQMPSETSLVYPHTSMAMPDPLYPDSSNPPPYSHYVHQPPTSSQPSPINRTWTSTYHAIQPPNWHHDSHGRSYDSSSAPMAFGPHQGSQGSVNYVNIPDTDDCMPFETYFSNDQPHGLGVLTPDQSPLAVASTVPEDHEYASSPPPKAESPMENGGDEHNALVQKVLVSSTPVMRSDGLKKKNAKFDIPKHRTIETIDNLISSEPDEKIIKELKAQKRLLKNREAALQSRQRKKQRADDLEKQVMNLKEQIRRTPGYGEQIPHLTNGTNPRGHVDTLQTEIAVLRQQNQQLATEKTRLVHAMASQNQEATELRNQHEKLLEQLQIKSRNPESSEFASQDYAEVVQDMNHIHFEHRTIAPDFSSEGNSKAAKQTNGSTMTHIPPQLLTTLLLYGAHIASTMDRSTSEHGQIPVLSLDDRVASKEMLEALFAHANKADRSQRSASNFWRKSVEIPELAQAYPRIVADLKSMFETSPTAAPNTLLMPFNG